MCGGRGVILELFELFRSVIQMELWRKLECFGNEVGGTGLGLHLAAAAAQFNLPGRYAAPSLII